MKELTELIWDATAAGWIPTEAWSDLILEASVCYGQLSGVISCVDYDLAAGNGDTVRVRTFPSKATVGCKTYNCECLSATSAWLQYVDVDLCQMGIYDEMCAWSLYKAKGPVKEGVLNEMAKALAASRDYYIINALNRGAAHAHATTAVSVTSRVTLGGNCCDFRMDLFNSIVSVVAHMRSHCVNPDIIIMNPQTAVWFYIGDRGGDHGVHVQFDANDKLLSIAGLKVIECGNMPYQPTTRCTLATIIDSSRAVAEAWGMRPTFTENYDNICNRYDETVWMYWGASKVSAMSVGRVLTLGMVN